jgi:hypothetical protein
VSEEGYGMAERIGKTDLQKGFRIVVVGGHHMRVENFQLLNNTYATSEVQISRSGDPNFVQIWQF